MCWLLKGVESDVVCTHTTSCTTSSKNNVKFCNSASYKSQCIYSAVYTLNPLEPGLSDETVEFVSDLFLFSHSFCISKRSSVSRILYSLLYKYVTSSLIFKAVSFSFKTNISTSSCPVIVVTPVKCSLARWNRAVYFQIACGTWEIDEGHIGQWSGTLVHGLDLDKSFNLFEAEQLFRIF